MNELDFRTIAAIATPHGYGGIGVIRISGSDSLDMARKFLRASMDREFVPNRSEFHLLIDPETGVVIDEVIVTWFKAPHSFTGEDVVEISCHGSPVVLTEILDLLVRAGAYPAQPGEFSLRAFLNQRIDLTQAEAINDLIHSQTAYQARLAARQLRGELSILLRPIKEGLIDLIVHFESSVEFVEDDLDTLNLGLFVSRIEDYTDKLESLAASYRYGKVIRSGIKLALIGRPNVGKSSIFNSLLGRDRAIVTHLPGTTRDTINEVFSLNGIPVTLIDTAGIRETEDFVEKIGVERTKTAIAEADLIIAVIEACAEISDQERHLFDQFPVDFFIINKCDLESVTTESDLGRLGITLPVLKISALTGEGIEDLKSEIYGRLMSQNAAGLENAIITNERHYHAIRQTIDSLRRAKNDLQSGYTEEVALEGLHQALRNLGIITGETQIADIINQIFSTFCIGK